MGVKYRVDYRNHFNDLCRVDILHEEYVGEPVMLRGVADKACVISWDCPDEPYEPIVNSKAAISVWQEENYPIDILELQEAQDREFQVEFYIEGNLKFKGFMIPDGIQRTFQSAPFELNINATDGLKLLDGITYSHNNLTGGRCIINYFRQILFATSNLNLPLPIQWVNELTNDEYPLEEDIFSGSVEWASRGEGFTDYVGNTKTCLYILEEMLRSLQSRIVQSDGKWVIWRINDVASGSFQHKETPATLEGLDITVSDVINEDKRIGGKNDNFEYSFIEEDAIITVNPALKTVKSIYDQDQRDNILPNGNMDIVLSTSNSPLYWELTGSTGSIESIPSLSNSTGYAVKLTNPVGGSISTNFQLIDGYFPIDTDVLFSYINFGFKFVIENGYVVDGSTGEIIWGSGNTQFFISLTYDAGDGIVYYLNEFGFWVTDNLAISISVDHLKPGDVAQIDFNKFQNIIMPLPTIIPIERTNEPKLKILFQIPPGRILLLDDVYINVEDNSDVYEASYDSTTNTGSEEYTLKISSSHSGFFVSNFMTGYEKSGIEKFFSDSYVSGATLTEINSHAILRNRYKSSQIFDGSIYARNYKYVEIYTIKTLDGKKFLPLKSSWNTETNTTNITLIEVRDDDISISMKHYGKNDKTVLSN